MEYLVILGLAGWVWLQRQRINALSRRISTLEVRLRGLAVEREPLLLDTPIADEDNVLVLDTPLPAASNDAGPIDDRDENGLPGPWLIAGVLAALYGWFGYALAHDFIAQSLTALGAAGLAGVVFAAVPSRFTPRTWRMARMLAPNFALAISGVFLVWAWPALAPAHSAEVAAPALAGAFLAALAGYAVRKHWASAAPFAVIATALVLGVAGYMRVRERFAALDNHIYVWALVLAFVVGASAWMAKANRHERTLTAFAGAMGAAALIALAAFSKSPWPNAWAAAPLLMGAVFAALGARRAATETSLANGAPAAWWAGAGAALSLLGVHALASAAYAPIMTAALAFIFASIFVRTEWRVIAWAVLASAIVSLAHAWAGDFANVQALGLVAPWPALAIMGASAALLYGAARTLDDASLTEDALRAAAWCMGLLAAFLALNRLAAFDVFTENALRGVVLMVAGHMAAARRDAPEPSAVARWFGPSLVGAGLALTFLRCGLSLNPWWGETPARIGGWPLFSSLGFAFLIPAGLALLAAGRWRERLPEIARACLVAAVTLFLMWLAMEVRHGFHGAQMARGAVTLVEAALYALIGAGAALALRTRADRERFADLVEGAYDRFTGGPAEETPPLPHTPGERRRRTRR